MSRHGVRESRVQSNASVPPTGTAMVPTNAVPASPHVGVIWRGALLASGQRGRGTGSSVGLLFGTIFAVTGRIFMLMCAHAAFDLTAVAVIYWNLESYVAHLFFK